MRFSITGGSDVTGSAERAPLRPALFDRLAVGVITVANSDPVAKASVDNGRISAAMGAPMSGEVSRPHGADHARGTPLAIRRDGSERRSPDYPSRSLTSSQAAVKPEADTLLPSVSGAYSPWAIRWSSNSLRSIYP